MSTADLDELTSAQPDKNRRYLQTGHGRFRADLFDLRIDGLQVFREKLNVGVGVEAAPLPGLVPFSVVLPGSSPVRFCGRDVEPGMLVQAAGGQWESRCDAGIDYVCCVFERGRLEQASLDLRGRPVDPAWLTSEVRSVDPAAISRLSGWMCRLLDGVGLPREPLPDGVARRLEAELLELTIAALDSARDSGRVEPAWRRRRAVRRVLEYLRGDPQPTPTIVDMCHVSGVSQRTLEYGFRDLVGVTPVRYLKLVRLNHARRALTGATPEHDTVTGVAMRLGFVDLGRFAVEYRQLFGERPSETLRRLGSPASS